jgi:hypothetical protein
VEYEFKKTFFFRKDLSGGLTGDELVTVPNPLMMVAILPLNREGSPMVAIAGKAIDTIFEPKAPFLTVPAMDLLFNGVGINCDHQDFAAKVSKSILKYSKRIHHKSPNRCSVKKSDPPKELYTL